MEYNIQEEGMADWNTEQEQFKLLHFAAGLTCDAVMSECVILIM